MPGLNLGTLHAGIVNGSPVWGFFIIRSERYPHSNIPNPVNLTSLPFAISFWTTSIKQFIKSFAIDTLILYWLFSTIYFANPDLFIFMYSFLIEIYKD